MKSKSLNQRIGSLAAACCFLLVSGLNGQTTSDTATYAPADCPSCAEWNQPTAPVQIFGNTYYVGTRGLAALLITSPDGHVLIDGGLPNSAPHIVRSIRQLGFREQDVKLILNSHAHYDHAGGLAALQRMTGAVVSASPASAPVISAGRPGMDDPQYLIALPYAGVARVHAFAFGDTLRIGPLRLVPHATPGHTAGGTTWTWTSCANGVCYEFVYADSVSPVSADSYRFTRHPQVLLDFEQAFARIENLSCDVLITPHPSASNLWERLAGTNGAQLVDRTACRRYAETARHGLARRLDQERNRGND